MAEVKTITQVLPQLTCQQLPQVCNALITTKNNEIAVYQGAPATIEDITLAVAKLTANFGAKPRSFQDLLAERIVANGFTSERLNAAVNRLLDEGIYNYKISDIIGFNASFKTYTQNQIYKQEGQFPSPLFPLVEFHGHTFHVSKDDAVKYRLKILRDYAEY